MKNVKLTIEYDGTNFCGWQRQKKGRTVQEEIEKALYKIMKKEVTIYGSGRTDAGVHALGQVANFSEEFTIPVENIPRALNGLLPDDVSIKDAVEVYEGFHARYMAVGKKYVYKIYNDPLRSPLIRNYSHYVSAPLDIQKMKKGAEYFIGEHDFKGFMSSGSSVKDTIRTIHSLDVCKKENMIIIETTGNGFLYKMVRIMTGTLVEVGKNRIKVEDIPMIIASGERERARHTAPAQGLYLAEVYYQTNL